MVGGAECGWIRGYRAVLFFTSIERVIYNVESRWDSRLTDFIGLDGGSRWPRIYMDLIDIRIGFRGLVCVLMLRIGGFGSLVIMIIFLLLVRGILFVLVVLGLVGQVYCGVGEISPSIPFVLGWLSGIGWVLEIG